jgi:hypothetical protein
MVTLLALKPSMVVIRAEQIRRAYSSPYPRRIFSTLRASRVSTVRLLRLEEPAKEARNHTCITGSTASIVPRGTSTITVAPVVGNIMTSREDSHLRNSIATL